MKYPKNFYSDLYRSYSCRDNRRGKGASGRGAFDSYQKNASNEKKRSFSSFSSSVVTVEASAMKPMKLNYDEVPSMDDDTVNGTSNNNISVLSLTEGTHNESTYVDDEIACKDSFLFSIDLFSSLSPCCFFLSFSLL
jgi:hypothetical protein